MLINSLDPLLWGPADALQQCFFFPTFGVFGHLIKILRIFLSVGHPRDPKGEDHGYLTTFRGINAPKSGPFKYENNAQTLPKQLENNCKKASKKTFLA